MSSVWLVQEVGLKTDGIIYGVFMHEEDAIRFRDALRSLPKVKRPNNIDVVERTLYYGQPPNRGYNP